MTDLLDLVYEAHGGRDRWQQLTQVRFTGSAAGILPWPRPDFLADFEATIDTRTQRTRIARFGAPNHLAHFTPDRVDILDTTGTVLAVQEEPRRAFDDYRPGALWNPTQAAYFAGYAFWTYLTVPFLLSWDGVRSTEIEPWQENGETWRRLQVEFPGHIVTHNPLQTLYFGDDFLLRRHDYSPDLLGNPRTANYPAEYRTFDGIAFPTRRRMVRREPDNTTSGGTLITLDVHSVTCIGAAAGNTKEGALG